MGEVHPDETSCMRPHALQAYRRDLSEWLDQYDWDYWATFTSVFPRSVPSWRRFANEYAETCQFDLMFWGAEADGVRPHVHALLAGPGIDAQAYCQKRGWSARRGGEMSESELLWRLAAEMNGQTDTKWEWDFKLEKRIPKRHRKLGRTEVDRFEPARGAAYYVGKYVTKRLSDYDIFHT